MADTIAAISTGNIRCAIGILRLSGDDAIAVCDRVFRAKSGKPMAEACPGKLILGEVRDESGAVLDQCLCTVSKAPCSYTGEDTAEIQCHGSPVILNAILRELFHAGARQAKAGEFTRRAFLNGKTDLTGAEAVIDLIDAETDAAARNAAGQLGGAIARKTDAVYEELKDISAHYHAVIDYPDEDIEDFELAEYRDTIAEAISKLQALADTFTRGRIIKNGVLCAIIGRPNVGKSSLLNILCGYERAIVTEVAGTTRDTVEEKAVVGGVLLRLTDTAGMHETADKVERLGVERSRQAASEAELIIAVTDFSENLTDEDKIALDTASGSGKPWLLVLNKTDIAAGNVPEISGKAPFAVIPMSAKTGKGVDALADAVKALFASGETVQGEIITNQRQADAVECALDALRDSLRAMTEGMTPDVILTVIENAMSSLGELTGKSVRDDVVSRIFERFCVGK